MEDVIENVKNGDVDLIDTVKLFIYFTYFIKKGLINYDMKSIKGIFFEGMNMASLNSTYCENINEELTELTLGEKSLDVDEIIEHFNTINKMLKDKMYKEKQKEYLKISQ